MRAGLLPASLFPAVPGGLRGLPRVPGRHRQTPPGCSGCSAGASGTEDPDLVVYNDSTAILGSISVSGEGESQSVSLADGHPLERGESYGFEVDDLGPVWVELWDLDGNQVGRRRVNLGEERVYVTLEEHSRMTVGTAEPWRN